MNKRIVLCFLLTISAFVSIQAVPLDSTFVYKGYLTNSSGTTDGLYDVHFSLYDSQTDGIQIGPRIDVNDVSVISGDFDVILDFDLDAFNGQERWISSEGKRVSDTRFTRLNPRQKIMPTPYAFYSLSSGRPWIKDDNNNLHYSDGNVGIGTTSPQVKLDVSGTIKITNGSEGAGKVLTSDATGLASWQVSMPPGAIFMWSGSAANIPSGWALCDGTQGTPNLMDRFIKSIPNSSTNPGETGGSATHTHAAGNYTAASHTHTFSGQTDANTQLKCQDERGSCSHTSPSDNHSHSFSGTTTAEGGGVISGTSAEGSNTPPYYTLAYIMKLSN